MFRNDFAPLYNPETLPNNISRSVIAIYDGGKLERFVYKGRTLSEAVSQEIILDDTV